MKVAAQLALALLVVGAAVGTLVWIRGAPDLVAPSENLDHSELRNRSDPAASSRPTTLSAADEAVLPLVAHATRSLAPSDAWLVADFRGDVAGALPFADSAGLCAKVPAPERAVLAILPPSSTSQAGPELLLAAPAVANVFWGCARDRVIEAGGIALAQNDQFEVLKSPQGILARGPSGAVLFLSGEGHLEKALSALSELTDNSATGGPHLRLFRRMHAAGETRSSALDLTLALPEGWLDSVGRDAQKSPLRFLQAAYLTLGPDGSAQGGMDCQKHGCERLLGFLRRAKTDMAEQMPGTWADAVNSSLRIDHVVGSGRIVVTWDPTTTRLGDLLGRVLGWGGLAPSNAPPAPARPLQAPRP